MSALQAAQAATSLALAAPLLGVCVLLLLFFAERPLEELPLRRLLRFVLSSHLAAALALAALVFSFGPVTVDLGRWYGDTEYALDLLFRADATSAAAAVLVSVVGLVTLRFAENYLHRDPGQLRFFVTTLLALLCLDVITLAATLDLLFVGWELLGLCSYLLIAFYHRREETVERALRAIFSYRVGDLGILLVLVLLHAQHIPAKLAIPSASAGPIAAATGLLLLPTAAAKAGLPPFSAWLSRSTEGPTPSTAMFYAALSVNAGPYLLLRAWPLYESEMLPRVAMIVLGVLGAFSLGAHALTRSDVKGAVVVAGAAQTALVVAEIGAGLHGLALVHMASNIGLRLWQILRAPSALALHARREVLLGRSLPGPREVPLWFWLWSSEGWFEGPIRAASRALLGAAALISGVSRRIEALLVGGRDETNP